MATTPSEKERPKLNGNTAVSLGLAIALVGGAATFMARVPTNSDIKVIVRDEIDPLRKELNAVLVEQARLRGLEDRIRALEQKVGGR